MFSAFITVSLLLHKTNGPVQNSEGEYDVQLSALLHFWRFDEFQELFPKGTHAPIAGQQEIRVISVACYVRSRIRKQALVIKILHDLIVQRTLRLWRTGAIQNVAEHLQMDRREPVY